MAKLKCKDLNVKKTHSLFPTHTHTQTHTESPGDEDKLVIKVTG